MKMINSCYKLKYRFLLVFIVLVNIFFLLKKPIYAYAEFNERTIRGTEIIHVVLEQNSNEKDVLNHIKTHINPSYSNSISSTPSYNQEKNSSLYWYIKDSDDDLLAIYFNGGERKGRDNFYDFIE
ncbi:hypothetical protein CHTY_002665, partial [Candidatus Phytoplasma meliae]|nr:hypothetical protein [Candidatus Phytoplasma meliae]